MHQIQFPTLTIRDFVSVYFFVIEPTAGDQIISLTVTVIKCCSVKSDIVKKLFAFLLFSNDTNTKKK